MRKQELINKMIELIDAMNSLKRKLDDLKRENAEIRERLAELENKKTVEVSVAEAPVFEVESAKTTEDVITNIPIAQPYVENALEYGSIAIGKVVQASIKYANLISQSNSENKKELLNLIMGKAEITKSEIFNITEGELAFEMKKELIDSQCDEAVDYFKSAYGQIVE